MMADVMGLGHGGDGAGDPPPPFRGNRGRHEEDVVPRKNTRGMAKNLKLAQEIAKKGGPLDLPFDKIATYTPVGTSNDYFTREVRIYMWNSIAFDKKSWKYVSSAEKNALEEHLKGKFDLEAVKRDREHRRLKGGIEAVIYKGYRDRKHEAKTRFIKFGGKNNIEEVRRNVPTGMDDDNWLKSVEFFLSEEHEKRSKANKQNREKQTKVNRGGSSTYSSTAYKKNLTRLQTYHDVNTDEVGNFYDEETERHYHALEREYEIQTQTLDEEGGPSQVNEVAEFEKELGSRRGVIRGIGRKPPLGFTSTCSSHEKEGHAPTQPLTQDQIKLMFQDPVFKNCFDEFMSSRSSHLADEDNNDDSAGDDEIN